MEQQDCSSRPQGEGNATARGDEIATPKVTNVTSSIFVPLNKDLTQPFDAPRDRIEKVKCVLESIEFHKTGGRQGILYLAELERRRILTEAAKREAEGGLATNPADLPPGEADEMIHNMQQPALLGVSYNMTTNALCAHAPGWDAPGDTQDREHTARELQRVMEPGLDHIAGYEAHMDGLKIWWTEALRKEEALMDAKFGRASSAPMAPRASTATLDPKDQDGDVLMR